MNKQQEKRFIIFCQGVESLGGIVLEEKYETRDTQILVSCHKDHQFYTCWKTTSRKPCNWCKQCYYEEKRDEFLNIVYEKGGSVHSEYINCGTKVLVSCAKSHEWYAEPGNVKAGFWCKKCGHERQILGRKEQAAEKFRLFVEEKGGIVIGPYKSGTLPIKIRCLNGHEWAVITTAVYSGAWCAKCNRLKTMKGTEEKVIKVVTKKGGELLKGYDNFEEGVIIKCKNNHIWTVHPRTLLFGNGSWCQKCIGYDKESRVNKFKSTIESKGGMVLGEYTDNHTPVLVQCPAGHRWSIFPRVAYKGGFCELCSEHGPVQRRQKLETYVQEKEGFILECPEFPKYADTVKIQCKKGHIWETIPGLVSDRKSWCPICKESKGELNVVKVLQSMDIEFVRQAKLRSIPRKMYDFSFVVGDNNFLLEFDGIQHFEYEHFFHKCEEDFLYKQNIDRIKTYIALKEGYKVIRIDDKSINHVERHICNALEQEDGNLYLSKPEKYEWLTNTSIPLSSLKKECIGKDFSDNIITVDRNA